MRDRPYPTRVQEITLWARRNGANAAEARKRFMQFAVLESIASAANVAPHLVFKGGNALRLLYLNRRTTIDLDFTALSSFPDDKERIRELLDACLTSTSRRFNVKSRCQRIRRNPPGPEKTCPTYQIKIGYQFPGDRHHADFERWTKPFNTVVELEISMNDVVCQTREHVLSDASSVAIKTCTLEDILAEKLRAMLQQPLRNRNRRQDVYDVARMFRMNGDDIDLDRLSIFLIRKCEARKIDPAKSAFNEDVRSRSAFEYEGLFDRHDPAFIPFSDAWNEVIEVVRRLSIRP